MVLKKCVDFVAVVFVTIYKRSNKIGSAIEYSLFILNIQVAITLLLISICKRNYESSSVLKLTASCVYIHLFAMYEVILLPFKNVHQNQWIPLLSA